MKFSTELVLNYWYWKSALKHDFESKITLKTIWFKIYSHVRLLLKA